MLYITFFVGNGVFWYGDQHPFMFVLLGIIYLFNGGGVFSIENLLTKK
jgi:putative oxidoreductase